MPKVVIRREDGLTIEADLSVSELKDLIGHDNAKVASSTSTTIAPSQSPPTRQLAIEPNFNSFMKSMSDRGRDFVNILAASPHGIEANLLASKLGYQDARQIGGLTGGGVAKAANKQGIKLTDIYRREPVTSPEGKRTMTFYPGKLLLTKEQKPA